MSKYTTELRFLIESGFPLFDFKYPFYDESKRLEFQNRFIKHFYFHEIGQETAGQFKHYLEIKFNEILPYYNAMFKTAQLEYDPLETYDITEEYTRTATGTSSAVSSGTDKLNRTTSNESEMSAESTDLTEETTGKVAETKRTNKEDATDHKSGSNAENKAFSDTPQGRTTILETSDFVTNLEHNLYNTNEKVMRDATTTDDAETSEEVETNRNGESTQSGTSKTEETEVGENVRSNTSNGERSDEEVFRRRMYGDMGVSPTPKLLEAHLKYQRIITTIENQFFDECNDLFMELW